MAILLLADHDNATLSDQTAKALTAAARIGSDVHVLVAGSGAKAAADAAARLSGVSKVLLADDASLANNLAEPLAVTVIAELLGVPAQERDRLRPWSAAMVRRRWLSPRPSTRLLYPRPWRFRASRLPRR